MQQQRRWRLTIAAALASSAAPLPAATPTTPSATFDWFDYSGNDPLPPGQQLGPDDYRNPILAGFYPDPSITRVGRDYYLVNSSFAYFPGLPIFHSRDLIHWTQIGNAIDRPEMVDFKALGMSRGLYAPAITAHDGTFYIVNTCVDCGGNFVITARDPAGPWSDPIWLPEVGGIDPSLFFDDDGTAWIVNNDNPPEPPRYDGHRAIWLQQFDPRTNKTIGKRSVLIDGGVDPSTNPVWIEGPHLLRKDGHYYLIAAEGGTEAQHSEVVFRSDRVTGPYLPGPTNPILTQRDLPPDRPFPITSAGHAGFVTTDKGDWWATFLAVRPYERDLYNTGRETFLLPVAWKHGWPRITAPGDTIRYTHRRPDLPQDPAPPIATNGDMAIHEAFVGSRLAPYWLMLRNPRRTWFHLGSKPGITLDARPVSLGETGNPSFLARRQQHLNASATTRVRFTPRHDGDKAGIAAFQNDEHWFFLGIEQAGGKRVVRLERRAGSGDPKAGKRIVEAPLTEARAAAVDLKIIAHGGSYDFLYAIRPGEWRTLAKDVDGTILSTRTAGGFVGTVIGMHAYAAAE